MRPRKDGRPSGPHSELVAQLGLGLRRAAATHCDFCLWELGHRVALVSQNLHQVTVRSPGSKRKAGTLVMLLS